MTHVLINTQIITRDEASVDIEDRAYQFGDGVYEVMRIIGGKIFLLDEHIERLFYSARRILMDLPWDKQTLKTKLNALCKQNAVLDGIVYVQVSRGVASRTHSFPEGEVSPQLVAYTKVTKLPTDLQKKGVSAILTEDVRWLRCDVKSLNLLGNVLAKQEAKNAQAFEAIMHRGDCVTEGSSTNVFIVKDHKLYTHPANHLILNGITRQQVIALCNQLTFTIKEMPFSVASLIQADEVFITSTTCDVIPVIKVDGRQIGTGRPGLVTSQIQQAFQKLIDQLRKR